MTTEGFKYSIKFSQSVSSGVIAFSGEFNFSDETEYDARKFLAMLAVTESIFREEGYKVASDIEPKENKKEIEKK